MVSIKGRALTLAVLAVVFGIAPNAMTGPGTAHAASCEALAEEFKTKTRPQFLRIARKNRNVATYYRSELNKVKKSSSPTRKEMEIAYRKTRGACRNAVCRTQARAVYSATQRLYTINRRWSRAGCKGTLS